MMLERGAKMLEDGLPEQAVVLYRKAADLAQVHDKPQTASDMFDRAVRVLIKAEKYNDASKLLDELIQHELQSPSPAARRFVLYSLLVHLKRDDFAAAKNVLQEGLSLPDFNGSSDLSVAQRLLQAYDDYDREAFKAITGGSFIKQMDPVYARLARSLDVPEGEDLSNVQRPQTTTHTSTTMRATPEPGRSSTTLENRTVTAKTEDVRAPSSEAEVPKPKTFAEEDEDAASKVKPPVQPVKPAVLPAVESPTEHSTNVEDEEDLT
ncbi:hypothetical protein RvY_05925 [Ramazzottius varieornatus]|uniref:Gamma-soluble NSF attachment protein n=1 Tax=Ramazzottius varieornatus TaxID=947166 RepID=A0A1D1V5M8_RAMVA|nr:hypothetical protein RvY_05925 [Ramazzottius varieornatus]